ncbi:dATP/dGTP pyrophosphohydrolase domain-containing protein [Salmonella enterica]
MTALTNNELTDDVLEYVLAVVEDRYENRKSNAGEDDRIILALRELQKRRKASKEPVRYLNKFSGVCVTLEQQPNASDDVAVYMPLYAAPPASEREQVRREHAEWSDKTFGDIGPVGPLKHLSKEALEAAADPSDPLEWADMQFLLWDAQRRMGLSDEFITRAMIEKLEINKSRQWPEPKDGEPRLHIKEQPVPVVPEEMPKGLAGQIVSLLAHNIGDKFLAQKIWNACRAALLNGDIFRENSISSTNNFREIAETSTNSPVSPGGWISCSERMPDNDESKPIAIFTGKCLGQGMFVATYDDDGFFDYWEGMEIIGVSHWMPLPAAPQQEVIGIDLANGKDASVEVVIENGKVISHG